MKRLRPTLGLLAVTLALAILPTPAVAEVARATLKQMVNQSDLVVVATVTKVEDGPAGLKLGLEGEAIPATRVATARVEEVWKGKDGPEVRFLASPTWMCDISGAEVGERVLLFLAKNEGLPFLLILHSGRGRMPIRDVNGKPHATLWVDDVSLPEGVATIPGPKPEYEFIRSVDLNQMKGLVRDSANLRTAKIVSGNLAAFLVLAVPKLRRVAR